MAENGNQQGVQVRSSRCSRGALVALVTVVILVAAATAVLEESALAAGQPPRPGFWDAGSELSPVSSGPLPSTIPTDSEEVAPYSENPTETRPYAICPPPTATRVSCKGVGVPSPGKLAALGLPKPSLEGSGKSGGLSPADLRSAYKLTTEGEEALTVAITIAYDNPNAESDLAKFREEYKLPPCTKEKACFRKVNQKGEEGSYPEPDAEWAEESSLDLDMVSAACPKCRILLVEANNNLATNMYAAVERAATLGATVISNSWEGNEYPGEEADDHYFDYPGVPVLFASGDDGYGVEYPSASSKAVAVGGTSLKKAANARGWSESAWSGTGSGCSKYESKPAWQKDEGCAKRTVVDVAAVADPETPVSVYDTYENPGWILLGGTSAATPLLAGIEALSSSAVRAAGPKAFSPAGQGGELFDITEGENALCGTYLCQAEVGYDGPTGWGTPNGPLALPTAVTEAATVASTSKATLRGSVLPGGFETKYHFEYGETTSYGTIVPIPDKSVGSGTAYVEVSQAIEGLKGQRTYHYRLTASNSQGTFQGVDRTFGTTPPAASTAAASEVGVYQATLNGTVNPEGSATTYYLEYGTTTSYGSHMPLRAKEVGAGTKGVAVATTVKALESNATYHYRVAAKNTAGTSYGADQTLTTLAPEWRAQQLPQPPESAELREAYGVSCVRSDACIAVGSQWRLGSYQTLVTLAEYWDGTSWSVMTTPNPPGLEEGSKKNRFATLDGVSCYSTSLCIAVGHYRGSSEAVAPLSLRWNGASWEELSTPKPSGATEATLSAVSCTSSTNCVAVGDYVNGSGTRMTLAMRWNGTKWEEQSTPNPAGASASQLSGISCPTSTFCAAVGHFKSGSNEKTLAERWNGTKWEEQSTPSIGGATTARLSGVSCYSSTTCSAVGFYQSSYHSWPLAERWNGSTWAQQSTPTPYEEGVLEGVSCPSATVCTAAGSAYNTSTFDHGWRSLVERWAGSTWSILEVAPFTAPAGWWHEDWLTAIACPEADVCTGVGDTIKAPQGGFGQRVAFAEQTLGRPKATTEAASSVTQTEATLNATVNPNGVATSYYFEYGPTTSYGSKTKEVSVGAGMSSVKVSEAVTGLTASSTYHFRVVATNANGTTEGSDATLSTFGKPSVETKPAIEVTETGANLKGIVNPRGSETKFYFEYGLTSSYGSKTTEKTAWSGTSNLEVGRTVSGLEEGTTYHFRIVATNSYGTSQGSDVTFKTSEYAGVWKITTTLNPAGTLNSYLGGVSCPVSTTGCTAVGQYALSGGNEMPMAEGWNGTEWALQTMPNPSGSSRANLYEVSCASASSCVAVGYYKNSSGVYVALVEAWNGSEWKIQTTPEPPGALNVILMGVSCTASTACTAVGYYENGSGTMVSLAERWNGSEWKVQSMPNPAGAKESYPVGVSCTSATACTMAGYYENSSGVLVPYAEGWNGTEWALQTVPNPSGSSKTEVAGVSCASSNACTLVGTYKNASGAEVGFAARWNGTEWAAQSTVVPGSSKNYYLNGVSCSSATVCTAVGVNFTTAGKYTTLAERWNGTGWAVQSTPNNGEGQGWLSGGISCASPKSCMGVGTAGKTFAEVYG